MGIFGQRRDTIEWEEFRSDVLFFKWKNDEIKDGAHLVIRPGQNAVFYKDGHIGGVFTEQGNYDISTQIAPFLSDIQGLFQLRGDSGLRAEVYFVNAKEMLMNWGTRQRIMIPTNEVPSGIPVGMNGNLVITFRDYLKFIDKIAGVRPTFALSDVSERVLGELDGLVAECILGDQRAVGLNALVGLQANNRKFAQQLCEALDKEMFDIGLGVSDLNIISINYPEEVQKMAEKVAAQSFVTDPGKYATIAAADGMATGNGSVAGLGAQMAIGAQVAQQVTGTAPSAPAAPTAPAAQTGSQFCPKCRKMVNGNFCPDCGTKTV